MVREHLVDDDAEAAEAAVLARGRGVLEDGERLRLRWNSRHGRVWVDGAHVSFDLELGDQLEIDDSRRRCSCSRRRTSTRARCAG